MLGFHDCLASIVFTDSARWTLSAQVRSPVGFTRPDRVRTKALSFCVTTLRRPGIGILTGVDQVLGHFSELEVEVLGGSTQYVEPSAVLNRTPRSIEAALPLGHPAPQRADRQTEVLGQC